MKYFLIASFFLLDAFASEAPPQIIGGNDAEPNAWPWQVSLQMPIKDRTGTKHDCGGSLINRQWVLTAAHCVYKYRFMENYPNVILGAHAFPSSENEETKNGEIVSVGVTNYTIHEQYGGNPDVASPYDIALLKLKRQVNLSEKVVIVELADSGEKIDLGTKVIITGWGVTQSGDPAVLQQVETEITECPHHPPYTNTIGTICAGEEEGGKDSCQGDSGGPLVSQTNNGWIQYGVVSYGDGCAFFGNPGAYMDVAFFRKWIREHMK